MRSEDFDKKIREAADHHHPTYDEQAWKKMNRLLEKHLPEERKRRRGFLFWFLLPLLIAGGIYLATDKGNIFPGTDHTVTDNIPPVSSGSLPHQLDESQNPAGKITAVAPALTPSKPGVGSQTLKGETVNENREIERETDHKKNTDYREKNSQQSTLPEMNSGISRTQVSAASQSDRVGNNRKETDDRQKAADAELILRKEVSGETVSSDSRRPLSPTVEKDKNPSVPINTNVSEGEPPAEAATAGSEKKTETDSSLAVNHISPASHPLKKTGSSAGIFFTLSAGPDVSAVGLTTGKTRVATGIGIGYRISGRFSVRTGFYSARKVYTADGSDYKGSAVFMSYYPNLKSVEGDCRVFEIPLLVDYHFGGKKKHSWFLSTGLSSLLMKKEVYDYYYRPNSSTYYVNKSRTFNNENQHFFSVADLSGGYSVNLNKTFSMQAEPYLRVPLTGIGQGRINLNSAGILFTLVARPFIKK